MDATSRACVAARGADGSSGWPSADVDGSGAAGGRPAAAVAAAGTISGTLNQNTTIHASTVTIIARCTNARSPCRSPSRTSAARRETRPSGARIDHDTVNAPSRQAPSTARVNVVVAAESLRADLRTLGQDTEDLDRLLDRFRQLDTQRTFGDPRGLDQLENDLIEGLKALEFSLWRRFGDEGGQRPAAGASARVPPQYREVVEEYYRSLARQKSPKP